MPNHYQIRSCQNPACGLRYPLEARHPFGERCPRCLGLTVPILTRELSAEPFPGNNPVSLPMEAMLDNVRSAWNVGAIFRTADGLGVGRLFLCGITPTPESAALRKTALGAQETVHWEYAANALILARRLLDEGVRLWALEQAEYAIPISSGWQSDGKRIVLIVGNEVTGVDPDLLSLCERIVYIPMLGKKRSLNVEVAFGVAAAVIMNP